ncbi:MAG: glycosyltransferase family 39 protein [Bacteroidota bacterium]
MYSKLLDKSSFKFTYNTIIYIIISLGVFFRLYHFLNNRSLWVDEIFLSSGLIHHTFKEIFTQPLAYFQKAPPGYLLFARLGIAFLGQNEMGLRIYSLICGIVALFAFLPMVRYFLKPGSQVLAIAILSFSPWIIYHSVEAKPYISELLASIIVILWYIKYHNTNSLTRYFIWGISGVIIVWFCYSVIFVLAATGITAAVLYMKKRNWRGVLLLAIPAAMWVVSFIISYLMYAKEGSEHDWLIIFWEKNGGYIPTQFLPAIEWIFHRMFSVFDYPLGLSWTNNWSVHSKMQLMLIRMAFLPIPFFLIGIYFFFKQSKANFLLLGSLFLIVITASALKLYPISIRLMTYLAPFCILLIAGGFEYLLKLKLAVKISAVVLSILILIGPIKNSFSQVINPGFFGEDKKAHQREALFYINNNYQPGDVVYVYRNDVPGYTLYKKMYNLKFEGIIGNDYRTRSTSFNNYLFNLSKDFSSFKGKKRVWIINNGWMDQIPGDSYDQPDWYYINHQNIPRFESWLESIAILKARYNPGKNEPDDMHVRLMDFSKYH